MTATKRDIYADRRRRNIRLLPDPPNEENDMEEIIWEEPPEGRSGRPTRWGITLEPLKERPNTWAFLGEANRGIMSYLRRSYKGYEFAMRKTRANGDTIPPQEGEGKNTDKHRAFLYARYVGTDGKA